MRLPRTVSSCVLKIFKDRESICLLWAPGPQLHHPQIIINILVRFLLAHSPSLLRSLWIATLTSGIFLLPPIRCYMQHSVLLCSSWWGCWRISDPALRSCAPNWLPLTPANPSSVVLQSCVWPLPLRSSLTWYAPSSSDQSLWNSPHSAPAFLYKQ